MCAPTTSNHLVITAEGLHFTGGAWYAGEQKLEDIWGNGSVWAENVAQGGDLTPLAVYLLRQARKQPEKKKYTASRNMTPTVVTEEEVQGGGELRAPRGSSVREKVYDCETGYGYIRYIKPMKKEEAPARQRAGADSPCVSGRRRK